ncbi:MAG TPA: hypothetical protein VD788_06505 [Candidatus Polarisedimenticolaceae bacterium]|nr:hypothetical protein [Candidatus Polarisedimenticolaceae bacterium]
MNRTGAVWAAASIAVALSVTPADADDFQANAVRSFANTMLRGVGAVPTECKPDLLRQVESRQMQIMCARFEGSFARFEIRWDLEMLQRERPDPNSYGTVEPPVTPLTNWEANGVEYDRIYRVEGKAIGVRFNDGDVLMVW